ncbi:hypothetical protein [Methylomagnum sp.]
MKLFKSPVEETRNARSFEVHEFIRLKPEGGLVPVKHYRTVYHENGRISREAFPVEPLLREIIRDFDGQIGEAGEYLTGCFDQANLARECAQAIAAHHGKNVEVSGTEVKISL